MASKAGTTKYYEGTGRRKTAVARIRLFASTRPIFTVNEKPLEKVVQDVHHRLIAREALGKAVSDKKLGVSAVVRGGGSHAQAEAIRQGIARALVKLDADLRPHLKAFGFLTRDPRMRERKKFGLKRARRARQWRKR